MSSSTPNVIMAHDNNTSETGVVQLQLHCSISTQRHGPVTLHFEILAWMT